MSKTLDLVKAVAKQKLPLGKVSQATKLNIIANSDQGIAPGGNLNIMGAKSRNEEFVAENHPHATFPNAYFVHGRNHSGGRVYYTGKSGKEFISNNGDHAFRYDTHEAAHNSALLLNKMTPNHGVHFTVLSPIKNEEVMVEGVYSERSPYHRAANELRIHLHPQHHKSIHRWLLDVVDGADEADSFKKHFGNHKGTEGIEHILHKHNIMTEAELPGLSYNRWHSMQRPSSSHAAAAHQSGKKIQEESHGLGGKSDPFRAAREHIQLNKAAADLLRKKAEKKTSPVKEDLGPNTTASDYIHDFVHSKNKKFKGDSKAQRIRRALGAYYGSKK